MRNLLMLLVPLAALSQAPDPAQKAYIPLKTYSQAEDDKILKLYDDLRVADVTDGLDMAGLQGIGLMDPAMRPLWRDTDNFEHRFVGIAVTARYVPTNRRVNKMTPEDFRKWESSWYRDISSEPFTALLRPGSALVIDGGEDGDTGTIGSNNILSWKLRGMRGVVTSGGVRDTDEIIKQKVPVYYKRPGRGIRPGRNEIESINRAVMCGGALVRPGDVIVADGDGVVVVPREQAEEVAKAARQILDSDKKGRRGLYQKLGMPEDKTVKP